MTFVSILLLIGLVAGLTLGLAFILDTQATGMRWQRRALYAALGGAFVPMVPPFAVILINEGADSEVWIVLLVLLVVALILAAVIGFPTAYWFCKRRDAARNPPNPEQVFE